MPNGHGGYRRPTAPAAASGPGALSKRTDGRQPVMNLPDARYGEGTAYKAQEQAAPMAQDTTSQAPQGFSPIDTSSLTPMSAGTSRPDEPITSGIAGGPGAGPSVPQGGGGMNEAQANRLRSYLPVLLQIASQQDADPNTRAFVTRLRAELG